MKILCFFFFFFDENPLLQQQQQQPKKKKKTSLAHQEAPNILFDYDSRTFMVLNLLSK